MRAECQSSSTCKISARKSVLQIRRRIEPGTGRTDEIVQFPRGCAHVAGRALRSITRGVSGWTTPLTRHTAYIRVIALAWVANVGCRTRSRLRRPGNLLLARESVTHRQTRRKTTRVSHCFPSCADGLHPDHGALRVHTGVQKRHWLCSSSCKTPFIRALDHLPRAEFPR